MLTTSWAALMCISVICFVVRKCCGLLSFSCSFLKKPTEIAKVVDRKSAKLLELWQVCTSMPMRWSWPYHTSPKLHSTSPGDKLGCTILSDCGKVPCVDQQLGHCLKGCRPNRDEDQRPCWTEKARSTIHFKKIIKGFPGRWEVGIHTAWCSEIGSLTSPDAWNSGASNDAREPISLHQAVSFFFSYKQCRTSSCLTRWKRGRKLVHCLYEKKKNTKINKSIQNPIIFMEHHCQVNVLMMNFPPERVCLKNYQLVRQNKSAPLKSSKVPSTQAKTRSTKHVQAFFFIVLFPFLSLNIGRWTSSVSFWNVEMYELVYPLSVLKWIPSDN